MTCNMGGIDRAIRGIVGAVVIGIGITAHSWWGLIGVVLLGTALVGFCPAYVPFRLSTRGPKA
ncbi:MAG: DUF2892 domain-containing protein [Hyphomicrobiales bacterium]